MPAAGYSWGVFRYQQFASRSSLALALALGACGGGDVPPPQHASARPRPRTNATRSLPEVDPGQVLLGLRGHEAEFRDCFQLGAEDRPSFVQLAWDVSADGNAANVRVARSAGSNDAVANCLAEHVTQARFGHPGRASEARWTFVGGLARFEDRETRKRNRANAQKKTRREDEGEAGVVIERSSPGKVDVDAVEGIVQSGYKLFAHCYRDGLDRDPELGGAVRLRFVIGTDGNVARVIDSGSDLPDPNVVVCVAESFFALRFPKPEGGNVHLQYRFHLSSG